MTDTQRTNVLDGLDAYNAYTAAQLAADMLAAEFAPPSLDAFQSHQWVIEATAYLCTRDMHPASTTTH